MLVYKKTLKAIHNIQQLSVLRLLESLNPDNYRESVDCCLLSVYPLF